MLKPSDFNNAVPQFSNGNYASNPINPQYVEEPSSTDYNRGTEPLQTLPAQWWNWFINKFTSRFNKVNIYVKNIFDELTGFLSLLNITPDGTESTITTGQLKNAFKEDYPTYVSNKLELGTTYVKQTTTVNGHALSGNVTITGADINMSSSDSIKLDSAINAKITNQTFTLANKTTLLKGLITDVDSMRFTASDNSLAFTIPIKDMPEVIKCYYSSNDNYSVIRLVCFYNSKGIRLAMSTWQVTTNGQDITANYNTIKSSYPQAEYATFAFAFTSDGTTSGIVNVPQDATLNLVTTLPTFLAYNARIRKVIVDINGTGDYTSVIEAVEKEPENTPIYIKPGVYEGTVQAFTKRIILIGEDRNTCVLQSTNGNYNYPAINGSCGYLENLTLYSKYVQGVSAELDINTVGAYAFHCENEYGVGKTLEFHHCKLMSDFFPALGMGMRKDFHCVIDDCILTSAQPYGRGKYSTDDGSLGAFYFHDSVGENGNHYLEVYNSVFRTHLKNVVCPYNVNGSVNKVYARFINNVFYSETSGYEDNIWLRGGDVFNNPSIGWVLNGESCNNSNNYFNKSHPMKAGSKFFGEAFKVINHTTGSSAVSFVNSTKVLGFLGFNGNDLDSVVRWNGALSEVAVLLDTLNFDKLPLIVTGKTDANDCVQPMGSNISGYGIACYYLSPSASNVPDSSHIWTIVTYKAQHNTATVVTQKALGQVSTEKVEYTRVGISQNNGATWAWSAWDKSVTANAIAVTPETDANNCIPEYGQMHTYFLPLSTSSNVPDNTMSYILTAISCTATVETTKICQQKAIGQTGSVAKEYYRAGYSTDSGSTWTWGNWKQVATADQLGDQATYSLSGNTLTITSLA